MELKQRAAMADGRAVLRLNRTFYGIETRLLCTQTRHQGGLNRTFYGIETTYGKFRLNIFLVLIVPFMELKRSRPTPVP